ncbi:hypothetical protein SLS60_004154 [Paraconiothyrium brasiliense]|uniref:Uncharacterized protein n=1 Tax=Paraconiothyrium brasiliense TaxID=300254 RepID=A0ABR3RS35_9PLEO
MDIGPEKSLVVTLKLSAAILSGFPRAFSSAVDQTRKRKRDFTYCPDGSNKVETDGGMVDEDQDEIAGRSKKRNTDDGGPIDLQDDILYLRGLNQRLRDMDMNNTKREAQVADLVESVEANEREIERLKLRNDYFESVAKAEKNENQRLITETHELLSKAATDMDEKQRLATDLENSKADAALEKEAKNRLAAEKEGLKAEGALQRDETKRFATIIRLLEAAAVQDREENEQLAMKCGKFVKTATKNRKEIEQLTANNRQLAEENKKLQHGDVLCDRASLMIEKRDEKIQDLQDEVAARKKTIKEMIEAAKVETQKTSALASTARANSARLEQLVAVKNRKIESLEKVAIENEKGISNYKADLTRLTEMAAKLERKIASDQQVRDEMAAQRHTTVTNLKQDIATKDETIEHLRQTVSKLENTVAASKKNVFDLEQEVIASEQKYVDLQASSGQMVAQAEVLIIGLREDAAHMVTTNTNLKQEATAKEEKFAELVQKHNRLRKSLKRSLQEVAPDETDSDTEDIQEVQSGRA